MNTVRFLTICLVWTLVMFPIRSLSDITNSASQSISNDGESAEYALVKWIRELPDDLGKDTRERLVRVIKEDGNVKTKKAAIDKLIAIKNNVDRDLVVVESACFDSDFKIRSRACGFVAEKVYGGRDVDDKIGLLIRVLWREMGRPREDQGDRGRLGWSGTVGCPSEDIVVGICVDSLERVGNELLKKSVWPTMENYTNEFGYAIAYLTDKLGGKIATDSLVHAVTETRHPFLRYRLLTRLGFRKDEVVGEVIRRYIEDDYVLKADNGEKLFYIRDAATRALKQYESSKHR